MDRRDFIRMGGLSFGGLNLAHLLGAEKERTERACIVLFQSSLLRSPAAQRENPQPLRGDPLDALR